MRVGNVNVVRNAVVRSRSSSPAYIPRLISFSCLSVIRTGVALRFSPHVLSPTRIRMPYSRRHYSSFKSVASFPDPSRPDLFYHLIDAPTPISSSQPAFALSFLPTAPLSPDSSTIIGWLPAQSSNSGSEESGLNDFKENRALIRLHSEDPNLIKHPIKSQVPRHIARSYSGGLERRGG